MDNDKKIIVDGASSDVEKVCLIADMGLSINDVLFCNPSNISDFFVVWKFKLVDKNYMIV